MRLIYLVLMGAVLAGCMKQGPEEKTLTLVNTGAVEPQVLESIRKFAQEQLRVPVRIVENPKLSAPADFQTLEKAARKKKSENDVAYIVVTALDSDEHMKVFVESGVCVVNTRPLQCEDASKYAKRIQRMVMRSAAFVFGLEPTPDPFCVTRDYSSLEDLDRMGNNYSPPWQARYAEEAAKRGLKPVEPTFDRFPPAK